MVPKAQDKHDSYIHEGGCTPALPVLWAWLWREAGTQGRELEGKSQGTHRGHGARHKAARDMLPRCAKHGGQRARAPATSGLPGTVCCLPGSSSRPPGSDGTGDASWELVGDARSQLLAGKGNSCLLFSTAWGLLQETPYCTSVWQTP